MHSNKIYTARASTVSRSIPVGLPTPWMQTPFDADPWMQTPRSEY